MKREIIVPENEAAWLELRKRDITSTDISALFNMSSYCTPFELWHRKKSGEDIEFEMKEWTLWGKRLQDSIAAGVAEDNGWTIRKMEEYIRIPELRMGSSFDFSLEPDCFCGHHYNLHFSKELNGAKICNECACRSYDEGNKGLLEIKNVFGMIFKDQWLEDDDGNIEAPPHIELQVQHQLAVSGRAFCYLAALVAGNKIVLIKREPDAEIINEIKLKVMRFWESIDKNQEPEPDFERDGKMLKRLYNVAEPGKVIDASDDASLLEMVKEYLRDGAAIKALEGKREAIKNKILTLAGDAEKIIGGQFSVSLGTVAPAHVEYDRAAYRLFKINANKQFKESVV